MFGDGTQIIKWSQNGLKLSYIFLATNPWRELCLSVSQPSISGAIVS